MAQKSWSDAEILEAMKRWAKEHNGEPPTWEDWRVSQGDDYPSAMTVRHHFGSWNEGKERAGFAPHAYTTDTAEIRRLRRKGLKPLEISKRLGIAQSTVFRVLAATPTPRRYRGKTAAERREERIAALRTALEDQES